MFTRSCFSLDSAAVAPPHTRPGLEHTTYSLCVLTIHVVPLLLFFISQDFRFNFDLLLGSTRKDGDTGDDDGYDLPDDKAPVMLHTFSAAVLPDARPIHFYQPLRLSQGADLRVEHLGTLVVGDGVAFMSMDLRTHGLRISDYGGFEDGGVFPTLVDGPAAVAATAAATSTVAFVDGAGAEAGSGDGVRKGEMLVTFAMYSGGRLEIGGDFKRMSVVALPDRIMAIVDVVLACFMGPPAARQEQEMEHLEEEVALEEEEEALGGKGGEVLAVSSRQEALTAVQAAYLYLGRMDAGITVKAETFALLLAQDRRDSSTNVLMAQVRLQIRVLFCLSNALG